MKVKPLQVLQVRLQPVSKRCNEISILSQKSPSLQPCRSTSNLQASKKANENNAYGLAGLAALRASIRTRKGRGLPSHGWGWARTETGRRRTNCPNVNVSPMKPQRRRA